MCESPHDIASRILIELQDAWNTADGVAFAVPFADDADFVAIRGDHHKTRRAVADGHQRIFDTIYKGSSIAYELTQARTLGPGVVLAHGRSTLRAPIGPLAGEHHSTVTLVLVPHRDRWAIAAFHNTLVS